MKKIIIIEYFTSKSSVISKDNKIFGEAIKLTNSLIKAFSMNKTISKVYVLRNSNIKFLENTKTTFLSVNKNTSLLKVLQKMPKYPVLFIAPETRNISANFQKKLSNYCNILNSSINANILLSSKLKTMKFLELNKINNTGLLSTINSDCKVVVKKNFSAGSEDVKLLKNFRNTKKRIVQKFFTGIKGSFLMICYKKMNYVISCNKQIIHLRKNSIIQSGVIVGGLENERKKIEKLADSITQSIDGLFGVIGVDIVKFNNEWHVIEINPRFTSAFNGVLECFGKEIINQITNFYISREFKFKKVKLINPKKIIF